MVTRFVTAVNAFLMPRPRDTANPSRASGSVQTLLGMRLEADVGSEADGWTPILLHGGTTKWIRTEHLSERQQLKVFFTDVGQGDATLIEAEDTVVIIDAGPNRGLYAELKQRDEDRRNLDALVGLESERASIDAVVITHFDSDHYSGLRYILEDLAFGIATIYHNGLPRYAHPAGKDLDLGTITDRTDGTKQITTDLTDLDSARRLLGSGLLVTGAGNLNGFGAFLKAAVEAADATPSRLGGLERLYRRGPHVDAPTLPGLGAETIFEILGPVPTTRGGRVLLPCFPDPHSGSDAPSASHTVNGNSIVLRLTYGKHAFLFGGDLNQPAQRYLLDAYVDHSAFSADVNKACHHGSSDFDIDWLRIVEPHATVFSSGDAGSYDHPLPDAIGAAAKHSQGAFPLVFSTELAREGTRHLGHINARSNKTDLVMAQKKEKPSAKSTWHTFAIPNSGPFEHESLRA